MRERPTVSGKIATSWENSIKMRFRRISMPSPFTVEWFDEVNEFEERTGRVFEIKVFKSSFGDRIEPNRILWSI